jgi:hypothetical protein
MYNNFINEIYIKNKNKIYEIGFKKNYRNWKILDGLF